MDAQPELALVAKALNEHGLEAILIGNMAAALRGAPVSTSDIDLFFRKTPRNMQKLKRVAASLEAMILRPYGLLGGGRILQCLMSLKEREKTRDEDPLPAFAASGEASQLPAAQNRPASHLPMI